jgi:large subunit ribosomal protein L25
MKLKTFERANKAKNDVKRVRREGGIPAVLYNKGQQGRSIYVDTAEFVSVLSHLKPGYLATTVFELEGEGISVKAIVKDIQYDIISYDVIHLDFLVLHDDVTVSVNVPIEFAGSLECAGVKLGGVIRQVIRSLKVSCLPKDMPKDFVLNVANLGLRQSLRLSDITLPENVVSMMDLKEVAVTIAKR